MRRPRWTKRIGLGPPEQGLGVSAGDRGVHGEQGSQELSTDLDTFETGVLAWGRDAHALAAEYVDAVVAWGRYRAAGGTSPTVEVHPAGAVIDADPRRRIVERPHTRVVFSWPV